MWFSSLIFVVCISSTVLSSKDRGINSADSSRKFWQPVTFKDETPSSPYLSHSQGQGSSSEVTDQPQLSQQTSGASQLPRGFRCKKGKVHYGAIPSGRVKEDYITELVASGEGNILMERCIEQCCELGPPLCQYTWIISGKCFAIGCKIENSNKCLPKTMSEVAESLYVEMTYNRLTEQTGMDQGVTLTTAGDTIITKTSIATSSPTPLQLLSHFTNPLSTSPYHPTHHNTPTTATPTAATTTSDSENRVVVSFDGDTDITLPVDSANIYSSTWPKSKTGQKFNYKWEKISGPSQGSLSGIDKETLYLSGLTSGVYIFELTVQDQWGADLGSGTVNVTVHSPVRVNTPPIPMISPSKHSTVVLPSDTALFDASGSKDDLGSDTLTFNWEEVEGPVDSTLTSDSPILQLSGLKEGSYKYKLTVTDQEGLSAVTFATVTVNPEPYYPPLANAGKDQIIKLPNNQVTLDGSQSTSFKGKLKYSWEKLTGPGPLDMRGTDAPYLQLHHISATGGYLFRLTVTDSKGQSSTANVSVVVLSENNLPPIANAGPRQLVQYPNTAALLNGSLSEDDFKIDSWGWTQLSGPQDIKLNGVNSSILTVEGLHIDEEVGSPTFYQFQLCVWDYQNLTDLANVTIIYMKDPKVPPHVFSGLDVNITLPQDTVILNGSGSYDDFGISSYQWVRSENSPAAGLIAEGSDKKPVLIIHDLVRGTYNFTLTVTSRDDISASDSVIVNVLPNPMDKHMLLVNLEGDTATFSLTDKRKLERVLGLIMDDIAVDYKIVIEEVRPFGPHIQVEFYAIRQDNHTPMNATKAYMKMTAKGQDYTYPNSNFHFVRIRMKVCQLPCSGHGSCDRRTHRCSCKRFWMENPIKANFGRKETNCDWSVFYVALAVLLCVAFLLFLLWLSCYCCMKKQRNARSKRRVLYAILDRKEKEEGLQMLPRDYQQTSLMVSDSETEEEILFQSPSKENLKNGSNVENGTVPSSVQVRTNKRSKLPNGFKPGEPSKSNTT